jgi:hypothetical protein
MKFATEKPTPSAKGGPIHFRTKVLTAGKTTTGIQIPDDVIERLGGGKRPAIRVTINGYTYRSTAAVMGGRFMVGINAENREKTRVAGGDEVDVEIALDAEPREVSVPADFASALNRNAKAKQQFEALSPSKKKALVSGIEGARTAETRRRRIDKAVSDLRI